MNAELSIGVVSLALLTVGCSMAWLPLGPIVLGGLLLAGLVWARRAAVVASDPVNETGEE